jgi:ATP-dependent protease ClpP protease subunit
VQRDMWMDAEEAIRFGIIDAVAPGAGRKVR